MNTLEVPLRGEDRKHECCVCEREYTDCALCNCDLWICSDCQNEAAAELGTCNSFHCMALKAKELQADARRFYEVLAEIRRVRADVADLMAGLRGPFHNPQMMSNQQRYAEDRYDRYLSFVPVAASRQQG